MSREASRKAAKELLALCNAEGVKVPTNARNALVEAGTMVNATKENGEFQLELALEEMKKKFGASPVKKVPAKAESKTRQGTKRKSEKLENKSHVKNKSEHEQEPNEMQAQKRAKPSAQCEKNQGIADIFGELSAFEFKKGERFKGGTYSKVAKAIRDAEDEITSGKQAMKLKGVGKSSAAKIDEFLERGTLQIVEEYKAGNL